MKFILKTAGITGCLLWSVASFGQSSSAYKMQPVTIQTRWAKEVSASNALKEYPRPQLERTNWTNLNGLWDYAITNKDAAKPENYEGKILVPYPIESALSGVKKALLPEQNLWYKRTITKPALKAGERVKLNFGAVDYQCWVYLNGKEVGTHEGGYTEFSFDITSAMKDGNNELLIRVYDPSDAGYGPRGKQVLEPKDIYYTPSSGIWQTVWMETVSAQSIDKLTITPDIDKSIVNINVKSPSNAAISINVDGKTVTGKANTNIAVPIKNAKLWSPASPYLYDLTVSLGSDKVKSYFGMRKISVAKDSKGDDRIMLNNKPYYNLGTLDQGFWPEGLHTAPTDEALAFDIKAIKSMGFNTIRKHIKIEPARWYYHADKIGMLVWQDFVQPSFELQAGAKEIFEKQGAEMLAQLHNHPAITTWVLFNEKWGQYDQARLTKWVKETDPSRIVNGHSGEYLYVNDKLRSPSPDAYINSDIADVHSYPDPRNSIKMEGKARICGEFGGVGVFIPDHQWLAGSAWGYITEKPAAFKAKYEKMNQQLATLEKEGLSGSIYTQPFDVEGEQNGIMTYDREIVKIPFAELRKIHAPLNPDAEINLPKLVTATDAALVDPAVLLAKAEQEYQSGKQDTAMVKRLLMLALQAEDEKAKDKYAPMFVSQMKKPYSDSDLSFLLQITAKTTDKGFPIFMERAATRPGSYQKVMSVVFDELIKPHVPTPEIQPDWTEIEKSVKPYGTPGEEIFLRAKTIHTLNQQDWEQFKPTAQLYLDKFGQKIEAKEKEMLEKAVAEH